MLETRIWRYVGDNNQSTIHAAWKFKVKTDSDRRKVKKAKLIARGCKRSKDKSIYAHVLSSIATKIFLAFDANKQLALEQLDVKAAYLIV